MYILNLVSLESCISCVGRTFTSENGCKYHANDGGLDLFSLLCPVCDLGACWPCLVHCCSICST